MTEKRERPRLGCGRVGFLTLSLGLLAVVFLCYSFRPDRLAALTVYPPWVWLGPGLVFAVWGLRKRNMRPGGAVVLLWLVFIFFFAEEPRSMFTVEGWPAWTWESAKEDGNAVRVISLNCHLGDHRPVEEIKRYDPDIVLLQESPSRPEVERLAMELFGDKGCAVPGWDASIVVRGEVIQEFKRVEYPSHFVRAKVRLATGRTLWVISTRLHPVALRMDLWSPECWRVYALNRRRHWAQLRELAGALREIPAGEPVILGGDMNSPAGDAPFSALRPRLRDSFAVAGRGWGNTFMNDFPVIRIDQVWVSQEFHPLAVVARKTRYSDHRIVICDLEFTR